MSAPRCIANRHCLNPTTDAQGRKHPAIVQTQGALCQHCAQRAQHCTRRLPDDYDQLAAAIGEKYTSAQLTGKITRSHQDPIPINTTVEAKMVEIRDLLAVARNIIDAETRHIRGPLPNRDRDRVQADARSVLARFDRLLNAGPHLIAWWRDDRPTTEIWTGPHVAQRLRRTHDSVKALLGERPSDQRYRFNLPCPRCGGLTLGRDYGHDEITCTNCPPGQNTWNEREIGLLKGMLVDDIKATMNWLLAEQRWLRQQAEAKLAKVQLITQLHPDDYNQLDAAAIIGVLREILDNQKEKQCS
ncbi:TFIIB-type zinc ribbon-containing protein [Mycobacterium heckeshornense]|uniref:TFIIB-type zinc ribbon-containing protein n=1 Tax=Mycobacterium heckeshornense TaxID=110505 RepID=UPI000662BD3C|nr:TFIIB-type zinc ribbon-containing protein [Mycobacterium heckeshornense]